MLSIYRAGEIDLFENLDIVHNTLLVESGGGGASASGQLGTYKTAKVFGCQAKALTAL